MSNRKQWFKVNDVCSSWKYIFYGAPQVSILGALLFKYTYMLPILLFGRLRHCKLCGWCCNLHGKPKKEPVIRALETSSSLLFGWFNNNFMKANSDKSHLIMSCAEATTAVIDGLPIDSSKTEVLLGITWS